jgi:hypothetical protein
MEARRRTVSSHRSFLITGRVFFTAMDMPQQCANENLFFGEKRKRASVVWLERRINFDSLIDAPGRSR